MSSLQSLYHQYKEKMQKRSDLYHAIALMHWDQEINLPSEGDSFRSQQIATLSGISHEMFTSDEMGELLDKLYEQRKQLSPKATRNVEETKRDYDKRQKYPTDFVTQLSRAQSEALQAWKEAQEEDQFKKFAPHLARLVELRRKECEIIGYDDHPYDALLDQYEPYTKTKDIENIFTQVKEQLVPFVHQLLSSSQPDTSSLQQHYPHDKQWDFGNYLLQELGYNFEAGRQDIALHPFTISFNPNDVRLTTRINEYDLREMPWSTIHEAGHALYEQGLPEEQYGLPLGEAVSLGIHESQSRLWENNVGRSWSFCKAFFPILKAYFPNALFDVSLSELYRALNIVQPSLIRTAADELTYHLHILIRFEIEKALIEDQLPVKDIPALWNKKYKKYLDIEVPSDQQGVLQDIHWSHGSFGYFPTYSLGSFYAAQFFQQAQADIPQLSQKIEERQFAPLLSWLRENIHQHGRRYSAQELCTQITGAPLNFNSFMEYAEQKYRPLYQLTTSPSS